MTPLESFTRLAAVGVSVKGLAPLGGHYAGFWWRSAPSAEASYIPGCIGQALLEAEWHRKWPFFVVEPYATGWAVFDYEDGDGIAVVVGAHPSGETRLEAMVLAAEAKHKENSDAR